MKKDEFGFRILKYKMPKRHISEQVREAAQKTGLEIKRVWYLKTRRAKARAKGSNK